MPFIIHTRGLAMRLVIARVVSTSSPYNCSTTPTYVQNNDSSVPYSAAVGISKLIIRIQVCKLVLSRGRVHGLYVIAVETTLSDTVTQKKGGRREQRHRRA